MPKGISLHIGVNTVDPNHYGNDARLFGCENDATAMQQIADAQHFESSILLSAEATTCNVIQAIIQAAGTLQSGDTFFMTYSGHGGQIWDQSGDETTDDKDETLCLFDRQYRDDEFNRQLSRFASGVRILWISDSCHATSNFRNLDDEQLADAPPAPRTLGLDKSQEVIEKNKPYYDGEWRQQGDFLKHSASEIPASLIQLAACKEEQLSGDSRSGDPNPMGVFTGHLLQVWQGGSFNGTYQQMIADIVGRIPASWEQTPQLVFGGQANAQFTQQKPFSI